MTKLDLYQFQQDLNKWQWTANQLGYSGDLDAAQEIDRMHEGLEQVRLGMEAQLRVLLKSLPPIQLAAAEPAWFDHNLLINTVDARAFSSARRLILAVIAAHGSHLQAVVSKDDSDVLEVSWDLPKQLTWVVSRPALSWPGIKVRSYVRSNEDSAALEAKSFCLAHRLLEYSQPFFSLDMP